MIRITFTEPTEPNARAAFREWLDECELKQALLNQAMSDWLSYWATVPPAVTIEEQRHLDKRKRDEKPKVESTVYSSQKKYYSALDGIFRGKCAYCETEIYQSSSGDIEHFRPKGNVKDFTSGKTITVTIGGQEVQHPGYYWLAYDNQNLLFSCELCNRPNKQRSNNRTIGKHDYFPLETDFRAIQPGEEINESPSFINPLSIDPDDLPENHLKIDKSGVLAFKTERGRKCIEMLGLNERHLPDYRRDRYRQVEQIVINWYIETKQQNQQSSDELYEHINKIKNGFGPYSMIARKAIKDTIEEMEELSARLKLDN
ncbi:MAG TPA: hypothetical protein VGB02_13240 [Pyrinomonadaceae bacterium]|jgi:hypothetical protein